MDKELKEQIDSLPSLRTVAADPAALADIKEGRLHLLEAVSPFTEVRQPNFDGKAHARVDGELVEVAFKERKAGPLLLTDTTLRGDRALDE